jgi:ER membrane protein complex subunit 7
MKIKSTSLQILLGVLPKIMSDPETKREMENMQLPKLGGEMPDMSEMISRFLGGGTPAPKPASTSGSSGSSAGGKTKKRN